MKSELVPEFAIIGHPNEGKSSVVSTLSEDDSVRISPTPGETVECRSFPVKIDEKEIIRFIDTPGFQSPRKALKWMKSCPESCKDLMSAFLNAHMNNPLFRDECRLLAPVANGAGIIFVIDGSRPIRKNDLAEMEILRLTARPRMAIINLKDTNQEYLDEWKNELRKNFNSIRMFNAHNATYAERIELLQSLKSIDQDWQPALKQVIYAFEEDWNRRNIKSASHIGDLLREAISHKITINFNNKENSKDISKKLLEKYQNEIEKIEAGFHKKIRSIFKHNIFDYELPPQSLLNEDLFADETWQLLGLTKKQLTTTAAVGGGIAGALIDVAAHGISMGVFALIGGAVGAGSVILGGEKIAETRIKGMKIGGYQISMGPVKNIQLFFVLLDRALIYYSHVINWAHGCRNYKPLNNQSQKTGFSTEFDHGLRTKSSSFFQAIRSGDEESIKREENKFREEIKEMLGSISLSERDFY